MDWFTSCVCIPRGGPDSSRDRRGLYDEEGAGVAAEHYYKAGV